MKALIFTRHQLTETQLTEIRAQWPDDSVELIDLSVIAGTALVNATDVNFVGEVILSVVRAASKGGQVVPLYGVIPAPLRAWLMKWDEDDPDNFWSFTLQIYEAWNIQRTPEGGKPTFEHKQWVLTQEISRFPERKF